MSTPWPSRAAAYEYMSSPSEPMAAGAGRPNLTITCIALAPFLWSHWPDWEMVDVHVKDDPIPDVKLFKKLATNYKPNLAKVKPLVDNLQLRCHGESSQSNADKADGCRFVCTNNAN